MSKNVAGKATTREGLRPTFVRYVEGLREERTNPETFFDILLVRRIPEDYSRDKAKLLVWHHASGYSVGRGNDDDSGHHF
jgi:hypothetical protein